MGVTSFLLDRLPGKDAGHCRSDKQESLDQRQVRPSSLRFLGFKVAQCAAEVLMIDFVRW